MVRSLYFVKFHLEPAEIIWVDLGLQSEFRIAGDLMLRLGHAKWPVLRFCIHSSHLVRNRSRTRKKHYVRQNVKLEWKYDSNLTQERTVRNDQVIGNASAQKVFLVWKTTLG